MLGVIVRVATLGFGLTLAAESFAYVTAQCAIAASRDHVAGAKELQLKNVGLLWAREDPLYLYGQSGKAYPLAFSHDTELRPSTVFKYLRKNSPRALEGLVRDMPQVKMAELSTQHVQG